MIGTIGLVAGTIIRLNDSTVIVQTQDPWMTFFSQIFAVFIGGIIALIANYVLQMRAFDVQGKAALMNQRMAAYSELLHDISLYDASSYMPEAALFHANRAALYGSPIVEAKLRPWIEDRELESKINFWPFLYEIKSDMETEIRAEKAKAKSWWQFWR